MKRLLFLSLAALSLLTHADPTNNVLTDCAIQEIFPGKQMATAFFTLYHEGMAQSIASAAIPTVSENVQLRHIVMKNGRVEMEEIHNYPLHDGQTLFAKGSYHLTLTKIKRYPEIGSTHRLILTFDDGSTASCEAIVKTVEQVIKAKKKKIE